MQSTNEQIIASDPAYSVFVSANAGTGKTKLLIDRILRILLQKTDVRKILALTYTNNAASEMIERITNKLRAWSTLSQEQIKQEIKAITGREAIKSELEIAPLLFNQILSNEKIHIQTIHSYCQNLLGRFPIEMNLNPNFNIIPRDEQTLLLKQAKIELLTDDYYNYNIIKESINNITLELHHSSFDKLINEIINSRSDFIFLFDKHNHNLDELYIKIQKTLNIYPSDNEPAILNNYFENQINFALLNNIVKTFAQISDNKQGSTDQKTIREIKFFLANYQSQKYTLNSLFEQIRSIFFTKQATPKKQKSFLTKAIIENLSHSYNFNSIENEQKIIQAIVTKLNSIKTANLTFSLLQITYKIISKYQNLKQKLNYLDFDDIILHSLNLLTVNPNKEWILYNLYKNIDHLLIDEAQDTNLLQWQIINKITESFFENINNQESLKTIFVVGDEKQSIFSFQGAKHFLFHKQYNYYAELIKRINNEYLQLNTAVQKKHTLKFINLQLSFRSVQPILDLVDDIYFTAEMRQKISFLEVEIKHISSREKDLGKIKIWDLIDNSELEQNDVTKQEEEHIWSIPYKKSKNLSTEDIMANKIANFIKERIENNYILTNKNRIIKPKDIMILFRKGGKLLNSVIRALNQNNIDNTGYSKMNLNDHIAIADLISLGAFLLLNTDDYNLANIIKSPLIDLSEEDLFQLCYNRKTQSIYTILQNSINPKYQKIYKYLNDLINKSRTSNIFELYLYILDYKNGRKNFIQRLGIDVNEYLNSFLDLCLQYDASHHNLEHFIYSLQSSSQNIDKNSDLSQNKVKILTIHKAKGLQAPIVMLPDTIFTPPSSQIGFFLDPVSLELNQQEIDYTPLFLWAIHKQYDTPYLVKLKEKAKILRHNEEMRLLYVALTRAEDELYICGLKNVKNLNNSWYNIIQNALKNKKT